MKLGAAPPALLRALESQGNPPGVWREAEFARILEDHRAQWPGGRSGSLERLLDWLVQNTPLRSIEIASARRRTPLFRYVWGDASRFAVALSLAHDPYFCHATAAAFHGLIPSPRFIYLNQEQTPKPSGSGALNQEAIHRAFRSSQRISNNSYHWNGASAVVVNGKNTQRFGVDPVKTSDGLTVPVTTVERTLIDLAVRPAYGGGPEVVLRAFRASRDVAALQSLMKTLQGLSYAYPYHQLVGFYLEHAGYPEEVLTVFAERGIDFDFYADYALTDPAYDARWRIFYPANLLRTAP